MNITNPPVPDIFNPRRRDKAVQALSFDLGINLSWLSHAWGRAYPIKRKMGNEIFTFPAVYQDRRRYIPVSQNSLLEGSTYFILGNDTYIERDIIQFETSIIFLVNLKLIFPSVEEYQITERLIEQVEHTIPKLHPDFSFESMEHNFEEIFREFDDPDLNKLKEYPLDSFRLNGIFTLYLECLGTNVVPGDQGDLTGDTANFILTDGDNFVLTDGDNFVLTS